MNLHLVFSTPTNTSALSDCQKYANENDMIVLIEDGVYSIQIPEYKQLLNNLNWKALNSDLRARGLSIDSSQTINYEKLVELTLQYDKTISWR